MDKEMKEELGERILSLMEEKEITRAELAKAVGVSPSVITFYIKGDRFPSQANLERLAAALRADPDYLLWGEDGSPVAAVKLAMGLLEDSIPKMTGAQKRSVRHMVFRMMEGHYSREVKKVVKIDREGNIVGTYTSASDAAKQNNLNSQVVLNRCKGKVKNEYRTGYTFRFEE